MLGSPLRSLLTDNLSVIAVAVGTIAVATLLNRFAPRARVRLRRIVFLFGLFVLLRLFAAGASALDLHAWAHRLDVASGIVQSFVIIGLVVLCLFELVMPLFHLRPVSIASDLLVGVAYIVATLAGLSGAGMDLSSLVATSAIVSGVLALSLQATLGNILGGVALQLDGSIHVGDWVQLDNGKQGEVKAIRWRHTVVETRDWDTIIVPNSALLASQIQILGKRSGEPTIQHRMTLYFNVGFTHAPQRVIDVVNEALQASPLQGIAAQPPPHCLIYDLARDGRDSFGYYLVRYWLLDLLYDDRAQSLVRTRVYSALRRAGIPLALPQTAIRLVSDGQQRDDERRNEALTAIELFAAAAPDQRARLAALLEHAPFHRGELMTHAGDSSDWMYLLASGKAEVRTPTKNGDSHVVAVLNAPDFFGEMGLMTGEPRTADVVALTDVDGYRLGKPGFEAVVLTDPALVAAISATLARRRVNFASAKEGLDAQARRVREVHEEHRILRSIQQFFGLKE
jgi:small-conductance mechanosensitive channel/CRP-like cAMP-binding protein